MTPEEALKVWDESMGFNEIDLGYAEHPRQMQEAITIAFRELRNRFCIGEKIITDLQREYDRSFDMSGNGSFPKWVEGYRDGMGEAIEIVKEYLVKK